MLGIDDIASAAIPAVGDIIGSAISAREAGMNRDMNREEARLNREWQERMSNTQYQRAMNDARTAGLNPILTVANQGGAGVPSGAQGASSAMPNIKGGDNLNIKQMLENINLTKAESALKARDIQKSISETINNDQDTMLKNVKTIQEQEQTENVKLQKDFLKQQIELLRPQIEIAKKENDWYKASKLTELITKAVGAITGGYNQISSAVNMGKK